VRGGIAVADADDAARTAEREHDRTLRWDDAALAVDDGDGDHGDVFAVVGAARRDRA